MRDLKKKDKLVEAAGDAYGKTLMLLPLDVCSDESVKQCINNVKDRHIDILSEWDTLIYPLYVAKHMSINVFHFFYYIFNSWSLVSVYNLKSLSNVLYGLNHIIMCM